MGTTEQLSQRLVEPTALAGVVLHAGHELTVYNRTPGRAADLVEAGARLAGNVAEACAGSAVVITMLADDAALGEVAFGHYGLCDSLAPGAIHVAMGTHGVDTIRRLKLTHEDARHRAPGQRARVAPDGLARGVKLTPDLGGLRRR